MWIRLENGLLLNLNRVHTIDTVLMRAWVGAGFDNHLTLTASEIEAITERMFCPHRGEQISVISPDDACTCGVCDGTWASQGCPPAPTAPKGQ